MTERTRQSLKFGSAEEAKTPKGKITAKTESQVLAEFNEPRVALFVCNNGAKDAWLALGSTAAAEEGIKLVASTGTAVIDNYSGVVSCATKEGESLLSFSEV
jgi:hypothetical protein